MLGYLLKPLLYYEYKNPWYGEVNERPIEYAFAFKSIYKTAPTSILDVGSGRSSFPALLANCGYKVTAIDQIKQYWGSDFFNRHFYILDDDITNPKLKQNFDLITCISVIEHINNYNNAINGLIKLLNREGYLLLTFPYNENCYIPNNYDLPDAKYGKDSKFICQTFSNNEVQFWVEKYDLKIINKEYYQIFDSELWATGNRVKYMKRTQKEKKHNLLCLLLRKTN